MELDEHRYHITLHRRVIFHFGPTHFHVSAVYETEREYLFLDLLLSEYYFGDSVDSVWSLSQRYSNYCAEQCGNRVTVTVGCVHHVQSSYRDT